MSRNNESNIKKQNSKLQKATKKKKDAVVSRKTKLKEITKKFVETSKIEKE